MKKIVVFLVSMLVILGAFSVNAEQSGVCGKGLTYTLSDDGVLEIKGSGAMDSTLPWKNNKADIKKIISVQLKQQKTRQNDLEQTAEETSNDE